MNHGSDFQNLWKQLGNEVRALQNKGYYGDGKHPRAFEMHRNVAHSISKVTGPQEPDSLIHQKLMDKASNPAIFRNIWCVLHLFIEPFWHLSSLCESSAEVLKNAHDPLPYAAAVETVQ